MRKQKGTIKNFKQRTAWRILTCSIFTLFSFTSPAFAASVSVTATVGATTVDITATGASYVNDSHCDPYGKCIDHSGGYVAVTSINCDRLGAKCVGHLSGSALPIGAYSAGSSSSVSGFLERAILWKDTYTVNAYASDSHPGIATNSTTFDIDNEPTASIDSPSVKYKSGPTDVTGTATFTPRIDPTDVHGTVYVYYKSLETGRETRIGIKPIYSSSASFSFSLLTQALPVGEYELRVWAMAINGQITEAFGSLTITEDTGEEGLGGPDDCGDKCGCEDSQTGGTNPVYLANGDKEETETDITLGSIKITRTYHSQSTHSGRLGYGWTWSYGWKLANVTAKSLTIRRPDGKLMSFADNTPSDGIEIFNRQSERIYEAVAKTASGWRYTDKDKTYVDFDLNGNFISVTTEAGLRTSVIYDTLGNPATIVGPFGRQLTVAVDSAGRLATVTDPIGRVVSYSYDANGNLAYVTAADWSVRTYIYQDSNDPHNLTGIVDEAGLTYASFTYDAQDRTIVSEHASGFGHTIAYLPNGIVEVTDALGNINSYTVSTVNGIPVVTSVQELSCNCGSNTSFTFDPVTGHLVSSRDKNGIETTYTYDDFGHMLTKTKAAGTSYQTTITRTYDASGHLITQVDTLGATTSYVRDAKGRALSKTSPPGDLTQWEWNQDNTLASVTAANGGGTSYTYNGFGQIASITNPDGTVRAIEYDAVGRVISVLDEAGAVTSYTYDAKDQLLSVTSPNGATTNNTYDIKGNLVSTVDQAGLVTTFSYDSEDRPIAVTNPNGSVVQASYDAKGNLVAQKLFDLAGMLATSEAMTYDAQSRLVQTTYADGTSSFYTYDIVGNLAPTTDQSGKITRYNYDLLGRVTSVTNPNNETVTYTYDAKDRQTAITTPNGATTSFVYDALGRKTAEHSPDRGTTTFAYDAMGNMISGVDGNGTVTNYAYDIMNRRTSVTYPVDPASNVNFTLDLLGRITSMTDASGTTSYTYDSIGNTLSMSWRPVASRTAISISYSYDLAGRVNSAIYPSGRIVTYAYGPDGMIASINTTARGKTNTLVTGVTRNAQGAISSRTFGNGIMESRTFDNLGRIRSITSQGILSRALAWNPDSTIASITDNLNVNKSQLFGYDPAGRITSATGGYGALGYTYDTNGNRTSKTGAVTNDIYAYQPNSNRLAQAGAKLIARDNAGNRLADSKFTYDYNAGNRLVLVADKHGTPIAKYTYNGKGERVAKKRARKVTRFFYNQSGQLIAELNGARNRVTREYIYLDGEPLAIAITNGRGHRRKWQAMGTGKARGRMWSHSGVANGRRWSATGVKRRKPGNRRRVRRPAIYFVHTDHLGTPQVVTNKRGVTVWRADYSPFGSVALSAGNKIRNNLRFPGQYFDIETGLHYNYFRDYDPTLGRYVESDPIGLQGGVNMFAYVNGNPVNYVDPLGLYGTKSCSYYDLACKANKGTYECKVAPALCPQFPDNDDPNGNKDKFGNWSECVRQCLQEKHKNRMPRPLQCSQDNNIGPEDNTNDHLDCFWGCGRNPENPYNPAGPNLPDGSPSLH